MTVKKDGMRFEGYRGSWYQIDERIIAGDRIILWESEQYGDEIPHMISDSRGNILLSEAYELSDIEYINQF